MKQDPASPDTTVRLRRYLRLSVSTTLLMLVPFAFALPAPYGPMCIAAQGLHAAIWIPWEGLRHGR